MRTEGGKGLPGVTALIPTDLYLKPLNLNYETFTIRLICCRLTGSL
jgi:hypothetical protein